MHAAIFTPMFFTLQDMIFLKYITKVVKLSFLTCAALTAQGRKLYNFCLDGVDQYTHP